MTAQVSREQGAEALRAGLWEIPAHPASSALSVSAAPQASGPQASPFPGAPAVLTGQPRPRQSSLPPPPPPPRRPRSPGGLLLLNSQALLFTKRALQCLILPTPLFYQLPGPTGMISTSVSPVFLAQLLLLPGGVRNSLMQQILHPLLTMPSCLSPHTLCKSASTGPGRGWVPRTPVLPEPRFWGSR